MNINPWRLFWGGVFLLFGVLILLRNFDLLPYSVGQIMSFFWPLLLIFLGAMILFGAWGWRGWKWGWAPGFGVGTQRVSFSDREVRAEEVSHGFGDLDIDLTSAVFPEGTATVRASHGLGDLKIWVPKDLPMRVTATTGIGDVRVFERKADGIGQRLEFESPDYASETRKLDLTANLGIGDLDVRRVG